ncbi:MAG: exodeoxyribonuclease VII large subunit, partial [Candidatus Sifarchaeia archaeon]
KIFQVSEFNEFINTYLGGVGEVVVEGEISELNINSGKWIFITIKDEESSVGVFGMTFKTKGYDLVEEGMRVHIYGTPSLYRKSGNFRISADRIVPAGEGALKIAFEKLKSKLDKEGLFDIERKRKTPVFPENIGFITAKNSRAYSDFVKVLKNRMGGIKVYFHPVRVQGKNSVDTILKAFEYFNKKHPDLDLVVLTRGGGSLEDLQSFNDESVARAIFSSKSPVVCGVGHEDDMTIADLVSDVRASTPSNAAEIIVRNRTEVLRELNSCVKTIERELHGLVDRKNQQIYRNINILRQAISKQISELRQAISKFNNQFAVFSNKIDTLTKDIIRAKYNLIKTTEYWIKEHRNSLNNLVRLLINLDFRQVLRRGFSVTVDKKGVVIKSVSKVSKGEKITTTVYDGKIGSEVLDIDKI